MTQELIRVLTGDIDGVNTTFTTPSDFEDNSFRLVLNGLVYESNHPTFGFTEVAPNQIELDTAPVAGESVAGFYTELVAEGSPFHPNNTYP